MKCDGTVYLKKLQHQTIFLEFIAKNKKQNINCIYRSGKKNIICKQHTVKKTTTKHFTIFKNHFCLIGDDVINLTNTKKH